MSAVLLFYLFILLIEYKIHVCVFLRLVKAGWGDWAGPGEQMISPKILANREKLLTKVIHFYIYISFFFFWPFNQYYFLNYIFIIVVNY